MDASFRKRNAATDGRILMVGLLAEGLHLRLTAP
jgi:hypothetical protein